MTEAESIGAIKVKNMILAATALTLGSLALCVILSLFSGSPHLLATLPSCNQPWSIPTPSSLESA